MEAGVVIDRAGQPLYWHLPNGRTWASLPDSAMLWDVLWESRARVAGFAHSHPGRGAPSPSHEDVTTFAAVEAALGRRLEWWIASEDALVVVRRSGLVTMGPQAAPNPGRAKPVPRQHRYRAFPVAEPPAWLGSLRAVSRPATTWSAAESAEPQARSTPLFSGSSRGNAPRM